MMMMMMMMMMMRTLEQASFFAEQKLSGSWSMHKMQIDKTNSACMCHKIEDAQKDEDEKGDEVRRATVG